MSEEPKKVGARCRVCSQQLTLDEFRACSGVGHYCTIHRPSTKPTPSRSPRPTAPRPAGSTGSRRGRRVSESGVTEYSCKAQFARRGDIKAGRLTTDHPSAPSDGAVFVYNTVGYGPHEVSILFIRDPEGRRMAERSGFTCHE